MFGRCHILGSLRIHFLSVGIWSAWKTLNHNLSYTNESNKGKTSTNMLIFLPLLKLACHDNKIQHINSYNVFSRTTSIRSSKRLNPWSTTDRFLIWLIGIYLWRPVSPWMYNENVIHHNPSPGYIEPFVTVSGLEDALNSFENYIIHCTVANIVLINLFWQLTIVSRKHMQ